MNKQTILDTIRKFEKTLEIPPDPKAPKPKPGSLLERTLSVRLTKDDVRRRARRRLARLVDKKRYGHLVVDKTVVEKIDGTRRFRCVCDCGAELLLTTEDVLQRAAVQAGCLGTDCLLGPMEAKMLFNPKFSLWAQLSLLLSKMPEQVANEWGGTAYECASPSEAEGQAQFMEDVWPMVEGRLERKEWWVHRREPILPYSAINVRFDRFPDPEVVRIELGTVRYGDLIYSLDRIADMFGMDLDRVIELRRAIISDRLLMDRIIEEGDI